MGKHEVRLRFSGFIVFAAQILSLLTGIIFTLLLTRNMKTPEEFGTWSFIFYLTNFFLLLNSLFPFWATRFAARGKTGATKTAFSANIILALGSSVIYLVILVPILGTFSISSVYLPVYALASLQILNMFLIAVFEGSLQVVKPQTKGYGLLIEELIKVALAFVLIVGFKQLFIGALVSIIVGTSAQIVFYGFTLKDELRQAIQWSYLKEWLKGSTAFIYNVVGTQLGSLLLYILLYFGGQAALGDYQAAVTFSTVIGYSSSLAIALYPKMLAQKCPEDVSTSLATVLMLALPMAAIALSMSRSLLIILNASYEVAAPILMFLTIDSLIVVISQFYSQCLLGVEEFDVEGKIPIRQLVRSRVFKVFSLPYLQAAIALPLLYYILVFVGFTNPVQSAIYLVITSIASHLATFSAQYILMRKSLNIRIPWKSIGKYVLGAIITGLILVGLPQTTTITSTFGKMLFAVLVYGIFLYAIDFEARKLVKQVLQEIAGIFRLNGSSEQWDPTTSAQKPW